MIAGIVTIALAMVLLTATLFLADLDLAASVVDGRCRIHEGPVRVIARQPRNGHGQKERIEIGDAVFEYSQFSTGRFYHQVSAHHGVLVDGAEARVCAFRGHLVRVEVSAQTQMFK